MKRSILIAAAALSLGLTATPAWSGDAADLARAKGCLGCHDINVKKVGPAYKAVAEKYKGDAGAADKLAAKIKKGGAGVWGKMPMPPQSGLSDEEAHTLAKWVLAQ